MQWFVKSKFRIWFTFGNDTIYADFEAYGNLKDVYKRAMNGSITIDASTMSKVYDDRYNYFHEMLILPNNIVMIAKHK
jgi:hypothetical protein